MCRLCVFQHFSFPSQGKKSTVQLCSSVTLSTLSGTPSHLASGWFQQLADNSDLVCLPADFSVNLDLPGIIVPSGFIHRFHFRIVATEVVFIKFHYSVFCHPERIVNLILPCFLFKIIYIL